jgi:hypothetical protein
MLKPSDRECRPRKKSWRKGRMKCCDCVEIAPEANVTLQHVWKSSTSKIQIEDVKTGGRKERKVGILSHVMRPSAERSRYPETPGNFLASLPFSIPLTFHLSPPRFSSSSLSPCPKELSSERLVHSADPLDPSLPLRTARPLRPPSVMSYSNGYSRSRGVYGDSNGHTNGYALCDVYSMSVSLSASATWLER